MDDIVDLRYVEKELPYNLEAEQALLGAALINNSVMDSIVDFLEVEHFANSAHQDIYKECLKQFSGGRKFTPVTMKSKFKDHVELQDVGGSSYLSKLAASSITIINAIDYARNIHDLGTRRGVIEAANAANSDAFNLGEKSGSEIVEETQEALQGLHSAERLGEELKHVKYGADEAIQNVEDAIARDGEVYGITTGLRGLDYKTGGMMGGQLWVLAGRPAMGKTALALTIAKGASLKGYTGAFFSIEMQSNELALRMASDFCFNPDTPVEYFNARKGSLDDYQLTRFKKGMDKLRKLPLFISDKGGYTVASVRQECRKLNRNLKGKKLDYIIIDYLQLMKASSKYSGNKVYEVAEITGSLKRLAKELDIPILLLCQLNRGVEMREDKRPLMSDLRDSGSIEQDADTIIFAYREHYYLKNNEPKKDKEIWLEKCERLENELELILGKQRHGPTDIIYLDVYLHSNAIRDGQNNARNGVR